MLSEKWLSRTSLYLEDILDLLEVPEVPNRDHDGSRVNISFVNIILSVHSVITAEFFLELRKG